jgi:O-antigen ligase
MFCCACLATIPYARNVTGPAITGLAALGGAGLLWARFACQASWGRLVVWPVPVVLAAYMIAIQAGDHPAASLRRSASMALFALLFPAIQVCAWRARALATVLWTVVGVVCVMSLDIAWQRFAGRSLLHGVPDPGGGVYAGSLGNRNDSVVMPLLMPLAFGALHHRCRGWAYPALAVIAVPAWWLSRSRQSLVAWALAASSPFVRRAALGRSLLSVAVLAVALTMILVSVPELRERLVGTMQRGLGERGPIAAFGLELFLSHPLTGVSPGMFGEHYMSAASTGWSFRGDALPAVGMPWVHNLPIEIACEFGVVGLVAFGAVLASAIRSALRALVQPGARSAIARGALCSILVGVAVGLVDLSFIKDWVRCWWWLALGLACVQAPGEEHPHGAMSGKSRGIADSHLP